MYACISTHMYVYFEIIKQKEIQYIQHLFFRIFFFEKIAQIPECTKRKISAKNRVNEEKANKFNDNHHAKPQTQISITLVSYGFSLHCREVRFFYYYRTSHAYDPLQILEYKKIQIYQNFLVYM